MALLLAHVLIKLSELKTKQKKPTHIQVNSFLSKAKSYLANVFHFDIYFN